MEKKHRIWKCSDSSLLFGTDVVFYSHTVCSSLVGGTSAKSRHLRNHEGAFAARSLNGSGSGPSQYKRFAIRYFGGGCVGDLGRTGYPLLIVSNVLVMQY
jgi:hypothetical protein